MNELKNLVQLNKIQNEILSRLKKDKIKMYNSGKIIHKKQIEFHKCCKRNRWVFGGNRSGKSQCGAAEVVWIARGNHPYKKIEKATEGWVVSLSHQVQRDVAQEKILSFLNPDWIDKIVMINGRSDSPMNGVIDYILIKNIFGTLSKIAFKSCDQGREKFQGTSLDYVWFDEEPPYDIYLECRMRVLDRCGQIFGTMTPLKGLTWVYNEIYLNEKNDLEVWCIHMEWADNPYLNKEELIALTNSLSSEELESRRYGKFVCNSGMVYSEFDVNVNVVEPFSVPREWFDNISIDPGLHNPLSAHWYAVDYDENIWVIAEHYAASKTVEWHAKEIRKKCEELNWPLKNGMVNALIDSAANQKTLSSTKSVAELFYENGIVVNTKVNKDLFSGISRVKSLLKSSSGRSKLFIFSTCVNMIREFKSYWWSDADVPVKKDDHSLDELRYYIMSRPEAPNQTIVKTEVQKHKEKLMAKNFINKNKYLSRYKINKEI